MISEQATYKFIQTNKMFENENINIAIEKAHIPFNNYKVNLQNNMKKVMSNNLWPNSIDSLLTNNQKQYLIKLDSLINNNQGNLDVLLKKIEKLAIEMTRNTPQTEQPLLLSTTAIAQQSLQYWYNNIDKWNELLPASSLDKTKMFSWEEVGKNDVAYGVGGGIAGALVGGSVSIGVLTLPGWAAGAIGGAIAGSVGNAILQLW